MKKKLYICPDKMKNVNPILANHQEYKAFFLKHFEAVFQFTRKFIGNTEDARDITQEAFIKLYERRADFDVPEKAKAFVYTTAHNRCLDYLRHKKIEQEYAKEMLEETEEAEEPRFLQEVTYQETLRMLHEAIDRLPKQTRQVILESLDGKSNPEIAEALDISPNTVKALKRNAYQFLRNALGKQYYELLLFLLFNGMP